MPRAGLTAERLAQAGAEMADEVGFEQVTISALARRFGVQVASLYSHVRSSEDLKRRITALALEEMADLGDHAVAGRSRRAALAALADVHRDYCREHPGRYAAATRRLVLDDATGRAALRHSQLTRAVLRGYDLGEPEETHAVRLVGSTIRGFVDLEAGGGFDASEPAAEASWQRTVDALDAVLSGWPGRSVEPKGCR